MENKPTHHLENMKEEHKHKLVHQENEYDTCECGSAVECPSFYGGECRETAPLKERN